MKKSIYLLLALFISITMTNCSTEDENKIDDSASNIEKFDNNLTNFVNKAAKYSDLSQRLNYSDRNRNINEIILENKSIKDKNDLSDAKELNHNPNEFDKHFIQNILSSLTEDDILSFFNRMEFYEDFVNNNINDFQHKEYLINNIDGFKWVKYSLYELKESDVSKNNFDACFDGCMEDEINGQLGGGNPVKWAQFLLTAAETVAYWVGSCTWDCW
ncbi:hypothetical protein ESY86_17450 [Subsaximicrobium wynnwilliamsii]|uniref:Lipoprotein n=1 Tax=Subsaximicrobium wynnwilliamsii TaxID=291179 RepID=A0A5C6ZCY1_9FLAO|nr:hypothetical protein [Subsaximicrobium wynnwilliamsii]TXD80825.1 hypothetical protein ESY87_20065 [Subsaximicrobium wynnwilliamsii]TXD87346.1 hypothetical protein ESY86_17450 [Subsaximicrobium wynnwilliamsii]TXE00951.1 hypothetical protein ESY88_17955 [Subsaximicrobium wynnwilliamsii]